MASIVVRPVTPSRWRDIETLFAPSGANSASGCWCMFHRVTSAEFQANGGAGNRAAMKSLVARGRKPGLLGYLGREPVGWVSVSPRQNFGRIERSPLFKRDDDTDGVWSITCFFVDSAHRGQGIAATLVREAADYALSRGARFVEAYPVDPAHKEGLDAAEAYVGTVDMFLQAGFEEVERRKPARPLMRYPERAGRKRP